MHRLFGGHHVGYRRAPRDGGRGQQAGYGGDLHRTGARVSALLQRTAFEAALAGQLVTAALDYLRGVKDWNKSRMADAPTQFMGSAWRRHALDDAGRIADSALRDQDPARPIYMAADNDHHLPLRAKPLPNAGREKAEAAALAVGATVLLPEPVADQVAKGKGTDWNDYEASNGRAATRAALGTAGLQELAAQDARVAAKSRAAERQGTGLSA
jgi:hypothetical protein